MRVLWAACALAALPSWALADTVILANGNTIEGIVTSETPRRVEVEFAYQGYITFERSEIVSIVKLSSAADAGLRESWQESRTDFEEDLQEERDYEAEQRAKGLQYYEGQWMTEDEVSAAQADEAAEVQDAAEADAAAQEQAQDASSIQPEAVSDAAQAPAATADNVPQTTLVSYVGPPPTPKHHFHQRKKHPKRHLENAAPFQSSSANELPFAQPLSLVPQVARQQPPSSRPEPPVHREPRRDRDDKGR